MQELLEKATAPVKEGESPKLFRVCFVCTGNTCRSPMAEALFNALAKEHSKIPLEAFSAGLYAAEGEPIAKNAVLALTEEKIPEIHPYRLHLSHTITENEAQSYDRLVGITRSHAAELYLCFPGLAQRIVCLPKDVSDPYGGDLETYKACLAELKEQICRLFFPEVLA